MSEDQQLTQVDIYSALKDELRFLDKAFAQTGEGEEPHGWKIIIVDGEEQVHAVTQLALKNFKLANKSVEILSAYSDEEAQQLLDQNPDTAVLLLDVAIETNEAGLDLVEHIRENLHNGFVRIVLRVGQRGIAPEKSVIEGYDINDYRQLAEAQQDLEKKVQERTQALQQQTLTLAAKNKQLEEEIQAKLYAQKTLEATNKKLDEANKQLFLLANHDALTGLANRRRFDEYLHQIWKQMLREQQPLTLLICDIDYFKQYNDTYGHLEGDICLRTVAQKIHQVIVRPLDLVARFGGEEFAIVLPNTDEVGGQMVADKLRRMILHAQLLHHSSTVSEFVTISIGGASLHSQSEHSLAFLINQADQALYQAKQWGRNQSVMSPPST